MNYFLPGTAMQVAEHARVWQICIKSCLSKHQVCFLKPPLHFSLKFYSSLTKCEKKCWQGSHMWLTKVLRNAATKSRYLVQIVTTYILRLYERNIWNVMRWKSVFYDVSLSLSLIVIVFVEAIMMILFLYLCNVHARRKTLKQAMKQEHSKEQ